MKIKEITICLHCGCNNKVVEAQMAALAPLEEEYIIHWNNRIDRHPKMYASYSELINDSIISSPSEWVILINDRAHPTVESVKKMISLLENGFACALLYSVGFMGFSKELIRRVGWWDERFLFGGWEDRDWVIRLKKFNLALYEGLDVPYDYDWKSPLNVVGANLATEFWNKKFHFFENVIQQRLPELPRPELDGRLGLLKPEIFQSWKTWEHSILNIGYNKVGAGPSGSSIIGNREIKEDFWKPKKILFLTTHNPDKQGDYLEMSVLHGFRELLGDRFLDLPKKKIMYGDFSESPKESLHGKGFSLLTHPIKDVLNREVLKEYDIILVGDGHMYGESHLEKARSFGGKVWVLDGHDLYGDAPKKIDFNGENIISVQFNNCFKRELVENAENVFPTGFGIPEHRVRPINFSLKKRMIQQTAPAEARFEKSLGTKYLFDNEEDYYDDIASAWFGLSCKKGGWDCLRHYEIIAAGTLLLFRDYDKKPPFCSPQFLPCFSYSSLEELQNLMNRLVVNNQPTQEYIDMLEKQRLWLYNYGTTRARARAIYETMCVVRS